MSLVPMLFPNAPNWLLKTVFWSGIILCIVFIGGAFYITIGTQEEQIMRSKQIWPLILMVICVIGFTLSMRWYLSGKTDDTEAQKKQSDLESTKEELISTITGGDSFCIIVPGGIRNKTWSPLIFHAGKYPLYNVQVKIFDYKNIECLREQSKLSLVELEKCYTVMNVGDISNKALPTIFPAITLPVDEKYKKYNIFFTAKNGAWTQFLRFHVFEGGGMISATKVETGAGSSTKIIYQKIDDSFPRNAHGDIDWE